jgi:hypothetical protein
VAALPFDGEKTWRLPPNRRPNGERSSVAFFPGSSVPGLVAIGPTGTNLSRDGAATWIARGERRFRAVAAVGLRTAWAVGEGGTIGPFNGGPADEDRP